MKKYFVTFFSARGYLSEEIEKEIDAWDVQEALKMADEIAESRGVRPSGFRFTAFDCAPSDSSGVHYINGAVRTLDEIIAGGNPDDEILIRNMKSAGYNRAVTTHSPVEWVAPFREGDEIVNVEGEVL
jgi:hypothetical protein